MSENKPHISSYTSHGIVLVFLMTMTALSVLVTEFNLGAFSVAVALIIASLKVVTVLLYFMHLKYESKFTRRMVFFVFLLFIVVVVITFFDYAFR